MHVRNPVVSGTFYDSDPGRLRETIKGFSSKTKEGECLAVISPHAGYVYSGETASFSISSLKPSKKFVILGPNHNLLGPEFSIMTKGEWATPLGKVMIDEKIPEDLMKCGFLREDDSAHMMEHSIEVQLPLLQQRFSRFTFVPVCIQNLDFSDKFLEKCKSLGEAMAGAMKKHDFRVIASSDFSHYIPEEEAKEKDGKAVEMIRKLNLKGLFRTLESTDASVCGYGPILVAMSYARSLGLKAKVIRKSSSGDVTGDYSSVVSYYSIGFG